MLGVIGGVVVDVHGGELVEALDEHAFAVGVDESQRSGYLVHASGLSPVFDRFQQGGGYFGVVDEVEPSEADGLAVPSLIGTAVDDGRHAPHHLSVFEGHEILRLAAFERGVFIPAERSHLIGKEVWYGTIVIAIEVVVKLDELFQFPFRFNAFDLDHWCKVTKKPVMTFSFLRILTIIQRASMYS